MTSGISSSDEVTEFGKVWHEGLLYMLKSMDISGELYNIHEDYLAGRLQRVI